MTRSTQDDDVKANRFWLPAIVVVNLLLVPNVMIGLNGNPSWAAFLGLILLLVDGLAIYRWRVWSAKQRGAHPAQRLDPSLVQQLVGFSIMTVVALVFVIEDVATHQSGKVLLGLVGCVIGGLLVVRAVVLIRRGRSTRGHEDEVSG